jgi:hypothetical protein
MLQQATGTQDVLEPGEQPWPAEGFPGPPRCRPISTVAELLTWTPPAPAAAAESVDCISNSAVPADCRSVDPCVCVTPLHLPDGAECRGCPSATLAAAAAAVAPASPAAATCGVVLGIQSLDHQQQQQSTAASISRSSACRPQLLVCHDMRGGYLDYEAPLAGSDDAGEYRIWHWDCEYACC